MGIRDYQGTGEKETYYRLALCLGIDFDIMMELPLWQVRERSFFCGEQRIQGRLEKVQDILQALSLSRSEQPADDFSKIKRELLDDVLVEVLLEPDESKKRAAQHNFNVLKNWIK